ncbi:hypothetical protein V8D89_012108 [Ganoderma adspersum]
MEMPLCISPTVCGTSTTGSHEAILHYLNRQFYDELEVCGAPTRINRFIESPQLVSPRFPIVFHTIFWTNDREVSSPSYFNIDEASEVKAYICQHPIHEC